MNKKVIQMVRYLQRDGAWVRGERLSAQFGVSTRQIRNYVSAANTSGCLISSSEKGYRLLDMNPSFRMLLDAEDNPESRLKRLLLVLLLRTRRHLYIQRAILCFRPHYGSRSSEASPRSPRIRIGNRQRT